MKKNENIEEIGVANGEVEIKEIENASEEAEVEELVDEEPEEKPVAHEALAKWEGDNGIPKRRTIQGGFHKNPEVARRMAKKKAEGLIKTENEISIELTPIFE